ncbi:MULTISPECIES: alpha/beta hydrolase [unclassified Streptomyces]|uniref:alpha/beta fold hydrolase n=1 Tax=unclassified Streptomyces TaxID=2593676 RepID=UPI000DC7CB27|nr:MULTISPECIES: alpha/beta hydrolase [unclassified Streptomyces]AWZ09307.1 alpha/beta hydrolase [Streptomyces sp. ICC4]AWZ17028.1 alpha/beta hydrolase [Streptomyces sp. ICC1]
MALVQADSVRFHVQQLPAGTDAGPDRPVVVFLHGLVVDNLSSFYCPLAVPAARAGHEVVLYDLRGHGRSERPATGYDSGTAVGDLFALLGELGLGRRPVHLVGNSHGGTLALHAALARPDRVTGLTLLEPPLSGTWVENMVDTLSAAALSLEDSPVPAELLTLRLRKAANLTAIADDLLNRTTLIDDIAASRTFTPADYAALRCPVLIVCGEHSELVPGARELARHAPRVTAIEILPGLGHDVLKESSGALRAAVLAHLDAVAATALTAPTAPVTATAPAAPVAPTAPAEELRRTGVLVP